jgi:hypothetical protein
MLPSDWWSLLLALAAIVAPLWLAWLLLGGSDRRKRPESGAQGRRPH